MELALGETVDTGQAIHTAQAFVSAQASSTAIDWSLNSVYVSMELDPQSCTMSVGNVTVVLSDNGSTAGSQLTIIEDDSMSDVLGSTASSASILAGPSAPWTGYEFSVSASPAFAAWYVPYITHNEGNHCGGGVYYTGECAFEIWFGQTNAPGGATGIAQGGTALLMACEWTLLSGWTCPLTYENWYSFYNPNNPQPIVVLPGTVNPGDLVDGLTEYNSSNHVYSEEVNDETANRYDFISSPAGFMGAPNYGEFESEDPVTVNDSTPLPVEDFSNFTPEIGDPGGHTYGCGVNCLLNVPYYEYQEIPVVSQTALFYGVGAPGGEGDCLFYTCYTQSYT
jgi:hypothetical protein